MYILWTNGYNSYYKIWEVSILFVLKENQLIWDMYFNNIINQWKRENQELKNIELTEEEKKIYSDKKLAIKI